MNQSKSPTSKKSKRRAPPQNRLWEEGEEEEEDRENPLSPPPTPSYEVLQSLNPPSPLPSPFSPEPYEPTFNCIRCEKKFTEILDLDLHECTSEQEDTISQADVDELLLTDSEDEREINNTNQELSDFEDPQQNTTENYFEEISDTEMEDEEMNNSPSEIEICQEIRNPYGELETIRRFLEKKMNKTPTFYLNLRRILYRDGKKNLQFDKKYLCPPLLTRRQLREIYIFNKSERRNVLSPYFWTFLRKFNKFTFDLIRKNRNWWKDLETSTIEQKLKNANRMMALVAAVYHYLYNRNGQHAPPIFPQSPEVFNYKRFEDYDKIILSHLHPQQAHGFLMKEQDFQEDKTRGNRKKKEVETSNERGGSEHRIQHHYLN